MKRSDFLKRLGIGLGAVVVTPRVLANMPAKEETYPAFDADLINKRLSKLRKYPLTPDECYPHIDGIYSKASLEAEYEMKKHIQEQLFLGT